MSLDVREKLICQGAAVRCLGAQGGGQVGGGGQARRTPGERGRARSVLLHLWDELEERVREQRSNGQGDEVSEHTAEKRFLHAGQDEGSQERGQVNQ